MSSKLIERLRAAGCVFAEDEAELLLEAAGSAGDLERRVSQRISGVPLQHVVGWADFCGQRILLEPGVFVPRPRSEFLVEQAVGLVREHAVVLDMCCGSGALGVAVAAAIEGGVELHASDIDPAAVQCARRNVEALGGSVYEGQLFDPLPQSLRGRVDVLIANVPYVPTSQIKLMPAEAREYEPTVALDGGEDGLAVQRLVAEGAVPWLAPGASLLIEVSAAQARAAIAGFESAGLMARVVHDDEFDATIVIATHGPCR